MKLTQDQVRAYNEKGFILISNLFSTKEVLCLIEETNPLKVRNSPDVIWEEDDKNVRALLGCHFKSSFYRNLIRQPRLLEPAKQLLGGDVYVYQFKINLKAAFKGEIWPWHQDFVYWHELDGMPLSRAINITIFLDECTEFNGPLWLIPSSHEEGILASTLKNDRNSDWSSDVSADLTFKLDPPTITRLVNKQGIVSPKGNAGTVLIFHPNLAHASLPNISPFERKLLIITYNSIENAPRRKGKTRPQFLVNPNISPELVSYEPLLPKGVHSTRVDQ